MRRFIYFDSDSINSYIAQIEKGLSISGIAENQKNATEVKETSKTESLSGDIGAKICGLGAELKAEKESGIVHTTATEEFIKTIQEKVIHDYAFDMLIDYLNSSESIKTENLHIGDFVLTKDKITIIDLDYFSSLFDENGIIKFTNDNKKVEVQNLKTQFLSGQKISLDHKNMISALEKTIRAEEAERQSNLKTILMIKNTIPYKRFLLANSFIVPLNDTYFRDNPEIMAFKYGGSISILGCITNYINKDAAENCNNPFWKVYNVINSVIMTLFPDAAGVYIIHPIAMYY